MKTRVCDMCNGNAIAYCTSDTAYLCWGCDSKVHAANFLVARHVRLPICSDCSGIIGDGIDGTDSKSVCSCSHASEGLAMPKQMKISSSSDTDDDEECNQKNADFTAKELTSQDWLLRKAEVYQEYMKAIPAPTLRGSIIPFTSWIGLGRSMKQLYGQPLHYLTNVSLKQMDQSMIGAMDEHIPLDTKIHPCKAEASIWLMEEVHRLTTSPRYLAKLWRCDPMYHSFIDPIFPHLRSLKQRNQNRTRQE